MGTKDKKNTSFEKFLEQSQKLKDEYRNNKETFVLNHSNKKESEKKRISQIIKSDNKKLSESYTSIFPGHNLEEFINKLKNIKK